MKLFFEKTLLIVFLFLVFISCKKGCLDPNATNYNPKANKSNNELCEYDTLTQKQLILNTFHNFDNHQFLIDSIFYDDFGTMIQFNRASFYLGKNCLMNIDNICLDDTNKYILIQPETDFYDLGYLPTDYDNISIDFQVGVDSITNHLDPAVYQNDHPLSYQTPSMHWQMGANQENWSYLFIVLEGKADLNNNGIFESGEIFVFHIGGDNFRGNSKIISSTLKDTLIDIESNGSLSSCYKFDVEINWASIIDNIDIKNDNFTHTIDNIPLATQLSENSNNLIIEY